MQPPDPTTNVVEQEDRARRATNLELFLDLVFVFAITQIASLIAHDVSWPGVGRGALIAFLVWWQWSQYTWAGAAVDLQESPATRTLVLLTIPATLTMATAIPGAFETTGRWFGVAYLIVQLLVLGMHGASAMRSAATRSAFIKYASIAAVMPVAVALGGFADGNGRVLLWCAAVVLNIASALRGAAAGEWAISPSHFSERHALIVIISLGEALVAIGASATGAGLSGTVLVGLIVCAAFSCVLWWMYFAYIPDVTEHHLRSLAPAARGRSARDLFTFGHFPIIAGIIGFAVAAKHVVPHPDEALTTAERVVLAGSVVLIIGGYLNAQWHIVRRLSRERLAALTVAVVLCALLRDVPGALLVGLLAAVLLVMQTVIWRRFRLGEYAVLTSNR